MSAAMLAFLPGRAIARLCSEFDTAGRRSNGSAAHPASSEYPFGSRRGVRSGTGFGDKRLRAVHRGEFDRREALRPIGRRGRDGRAAMSQRAEALTRYEDARRCRSGGAQRDGFDAGRAQDET